MPNPKFTVTSPIVESESQQASDCSSPIVVDSSTNGTEETEEEVQDGRHTVVHFTPGGHQRSDSNFEGGYDTLNGNTTFNNATQLSFFNSGNAGTYMHYDSADPVPATVFYRNRDSTTELNGKAKNRPTLQELREQFDDKEDPTKLVNKSNGQGTKRFDVSSTPNFFELPYVGENEEVDGEPKGEKLDEEEAAAAAAATPASKQIKFGWVQGVLVRCLLNIWGAMLFLRLGFVYGQAGLIVGTVIMLLCAIVTVITTLSMSAICTNGQVKGGGAYFMISRSIGPEFGGAIGILYSFATAVAMSLYVVAFAEALLDIIPDFLDNELNEIRVIGLGLCCVVVFIAFCGMGIVTRTQLALLFLMFAAMISIIIGSFIGPKSQSEEDKGFVGYDSTVASDQLTPGFTEGEDFFSIFAIFFPAATGVLAGANLSGDLKNPSTAIPKGTLLGILITTVVYIILGVIMVTCYLRVVMVDDGNGNLVESTTLGLNYDFTSMQIVSAWAPLVLAGIFAATLSSAIGAFVGAPRIFAAVCKDKLFPKIFDGFAKQNERGDPIRGYILVFCIGVGFTLIGSLNSIAPILSNFFLMSYALINYSCFVASLSNAPGFRPSFKYYNPWVSLLGALLCLAIMFLINWYLALVTFVLVVAIHRYIDFRKPDVNWGSAGQAMAYSNALRAMHRLEKQQSHIKTFRPNFLVLMGDYQRRQDMARFICQVNNGLGSVIFGNVLVGTTDLTHVKSFKRGLNQDTLLQLKAFDETVAAPTLRAGARSLLQLNGLGKLRANLMVLGYLRDWENAERGELDEYVGIINDAFDLDYNVAVMRCPVVEKQWSLPFFGSPMTGNIDIWWIADDGGLTLLLPYLLSQHKQWKKCNLRVFVPGNPKQMSSEKVRISRLLKKFRIDAEPVVVDSVSRKPSKKRMADFKKRLGTEDLSTKISDRMMKYVRLAEVMEQTSDQATLVIATLPLPLRTNQDSFVYLNVLDHMTRNLPPTLLLRGNQESVLTFYS
eukprot:Clim_evm106s128 gene=Clim_evmTU106s128